MTRPSSRLQFFALEAGDYLERMALIVGRPVAPDGDELVRLARALRGAALMAGPPGFSAAATSLELVTKEYREGRVIWEPGIQEALADAAEEFKRLLRQLATWTDGDQDAAEDLARSTAELIGRDVAEVRAKPARLDGADTQPSVRAFVAREVAAVSATLEHAAQAVELRSPSDAFDIVLRRLQPIRGLGLPAAFAPLPELLDALELVIADLRDGAAAPPLGADGLRAAARALSTMAREVADQGHPSEPGTDALLAAQAFLQSFGSDRDVVPIGSLAPGGGSDQVIYRAPRPDSGADRVAASMALVSLADRLRQAADQLGATPSAAARSFQLFLLLYQLQGIGSSGSEAASARDLIASLNRAVFAGRADRERERFADLLRRAADRIVEAADTKQFAALETALTGLGVELEGIELAIPMARVEATDADVVPVESLLLTEPVPVEDDGPIVPIDSLTVDRVPFELSFSTFYALSSHDAVAAPVPRAAQPTDAPIGVEPLPSPAAGAREVAPPAAEPEADPVPIATLLYRGRSALERAAAVSLELERLLRTSAGTEVTSPLLGELLDLVPLALAD